MPRETQAERSRRREEAEATASPRLLTSAATNPIAICLLLAALTFIVFYPALRCDFLNYDDRDYFVNNPLVQNGLTGEGVREAFTTTPIGNWDPLVWLSFQTDVQLFGPGPRGPHFTNVLLHSANAALLFLLLNTLTGSRWRSALVAALFALHPLRVESVAWVAERKDVLSGCFALLTLLAYACHALRTTHHASAPNSHPTFRISGYYWLALVCFALALMSKATVLPLPFLMLVLDYWPLSRLTGENWRSNLHRLTLEKIPFLLLAIAVGTVSVIIHQKSNALASLADAPLTSRIANAFVVYTCYWGKMFWPLNLALPYPRVEHWPLMMSALSAALVLGGSVAIVRLSRHLPFLFTGWFWFLGMLVPVIGLVQWGDQSMADRFTYLPSIGFLILLVWTAGEVISEWRLPKAVIAIAPALLLVACMVFTRGQLDYWQNSETLFRHALAVTDTNKNYVAHSNLGLVYAETARFDEALQSFAKALEINPKHVVSLNNFAALLSRRGRTAEAAACLRRALEIDPTSATAHLNLGQIHMAQGKLTDAIQEFETALRVKPGYLSAHKNLALALLRIGRQVDAIEHFRFVVKREPANVETLNNLGSALATKGEMTEAMRLFRKVIRLTPTKPDGYFNLGLALLAQQRREEAIQQFQETLRVRPDFFQARDQLRALGVGQ